MKEGVHPQDIKEQTQRGAFVEVFDEATGSVTQVYWNGGLKITGADGNEYPITPEHAASFRLTHLNNQKLKR